MLCSYRRQQLHHFLNDGLPLSKDVMLSFLSLFFAIEVFESSLGFPSSLCFYNHEY